MERERLIVQNYIEQGTVHLQTAFDSARVLDKTNVRKRFMKKLTRDRVVPTISAKVS